MKKNKQEQGFTLVEMSIVIVIIGLMFVGFLETYKIYDEKQKMGRMNSYEVDINAALTSFPSMVTDASVDPDKKNNRMPCPAPLNGQGHGNNYSSEVRNGAGVCQGVLRVSGPSGNILIGKFPTASLKMSNDYMKDVYGNYTIYAVSESATREASYNSSPGAITIKEEVINSDPKLGPVGKIIELPPKKNMLYALISPGESGTGAVDFNGKVINPCKKGSKEAENCINLTKVSSNDEVFVKSVKSENKNSKLFYDDRVTYKDKIGDTSADLPTVITPAQLGKHFEIKDPDLKHKQISRVMKHGGSGNHEHEYYLTTFDVNGEQKLQFNEDSYLEVKLEEPVYTDVPVQGPSKENSYGTVSVATDKNEATKLIKINKGDNVVFKYEGQGSHTQPKSSHSWEKFAPKDYQANANKVSLKINDEKPIPLIDAERSDTFTKFDKLKGESIDTESYVTAVPFGTKDTPYTLDGNKSSSAPEGYNGKFQVNGGQNVQYQIWVDK